MTQEEKSRKYNQLLSEYDKIANKISEIKGQSLDLNPNQLREINELQAKQSQIRNTVEKLLM